MSIVPRRRKPDPVAGFLDTVTLDQLRDLGSRTRIEGAIRARCMVVNVDPHTALCRVLGRNKMYVDLRDRGFVPHLMFEGYWEYWLTAFLWRNVKPGQVALDLGANHGYYTVLLAELVGEGGMVHAFEPNPRMVELLSDNVAVNGFWRSVRVHAAAVGDAAGTAPLFVPVQDPKNAYMHPPRPLTDGPLDPARQQIHQVPVVVLDEVIAGPVDVVKMDVEGAEEAAWRGMQRLVARSPGIAIILEFNPRRCADPAGTLRGMAARFPLRELPLDGPVRRVTEAEILARLEDTLLYLSERDPA